MQIVLTKDVPNLGRKGDVKTVKNGYYVNFLAPNSKAVRLTPKLKKEIEKQQKARTERRAAMLEKAEEMAAQIEKMTVSFTKKATSKGKLYGSITEDMIQAQIEKQLKFDLDSGSIKIAEHLKTVGEHEGTVKLTDKVSAKLKIVIKSE